MVIVKDLLDKAEKLNKYIGLLGKTPQNSLDCAMVEDIRTLLFEYREFILAIKVNWPYEQRS